MSETYMITAKTVEEAIAIANREYADENHEVSYEIIDMPKKGFLGIGAKDAKIKITVSKSVSSELDSLVADLRGMKVLTSKGDSGENGKSEKKSGSQQKKRPEGEKQTNQGAKQQKPQNKQQKPEKQPEKVQNGSQQRSDKTQPAKDAQNQQNQKAERQQKQNQPKAENKPVKENKPAEKQNDKQNTKPAAKPAESKQPKQEKPQQKAESKAEAKTEPVQESVKKPVEAVEPASEKRESKSSLRNQAKPGKRQQQKHGQPEQNIPASSFTVSAPMGLTDFVAEENADSFGSAKNDTGRSAGRMNNDIRHGKKNAPKQEAKTESKTPKFDRKGERVIYEDRQAMTTRYDVAESDEDYIKLNNLEDRELTIDEIRASVKASNESAADTSALDAAIEAAVEIAPKAEKTRREAVSEAEMTFALEFANTLLKNMGLDASAVPAECPEDEEFDVTEECTVYPKINIIGDDTGILIGHHGETLDSIQYLVNLSALRKSKQKDGDYVKIVVDIENYREKREETLRALARRMAARAVKYKRNVFLEPMNAYERRIIHSELQNVENVSTHSVGADRDRKIIITYEGVDKAPENRSRRRRGHGKGHGGNANANASENAVNESVETGAESSDKVQGSGSNRERRRPRKVQKMPIEKIGDILPDSEAVNSDHSDSEE